MSDSTAAQFRIRASADLALLDAYLKPYATWPEAVAFQNEARRRLRVLQVYYDKLPRDAERWEEGLNKESATIFLNCRLIVLGYDPPGWEPEAWAALAVLADMEGCDLEIPDQSHRFILRLRAKAMVEDAAYRRRTFMASGVGQKPYTARLEEVPGWVYALFRSKQQAFVLALWGGRWMSEPELLHKLDIANADPENLAKLVTRVRDRLSTPEVLAETDGVMWTVIAEKRGGSSGFMLLPVGGQK